MNRILIAWIGNTDLRASKGELENELGPICQAAVTRQYSHIALVSNYKKEDEKHFISWLMGKTKASVLKYHVDLVSPTDYKSIYECASSTLLQVREKFKSSPSLFTYHLSPGTPAMTAVWIILAKTTFPAELIESSRQQGVKTVQLPFDISAEYVPDIVRPEDEELLNLTQGLPPESPEFAAIIHKCAVMKRVIAQARRLAAHNVPVLIQGESGTGKELFSRAIHTASDRSNHPFIAVNCGSIPPELVESAFFGHKKGAFTGAIADKEGYFHAANKGTLFLDELGELPLTAQVKLLRVLQEGMIMSVGASSSQKIDVRIIAATNRNLIEEVSAGHFREDLFHRIAVGVIRLPSLRERKGDLNLIIDHLIRQINMIFSGRSGWKPKDLSVGARNLLHQHSWPGNVRELYNTLTRASIWSVSEKITAEDIQESLFSVRTTQQSDGSILNRSLGNGFSLPEVMAEVARHYLKRAVAEGKGNKGKISELLGLSNYQTASNWMKRYGIES
jgi:transcriptional regulator with PAS, ATPase and Fis domain